MERRYAIIIGINDYENGPLDFCVNDAVAIKALLTDRANFAADDIYLISSDSDGSLKDITGKLFEAIGKIQQTFIKKQDSIFFYFAGHGFSDGTSSYLVFHDSKYSIPDAFKIVNSLDPRMQFYVIDACESGSKTLTRRVTEVDASGGIDELIASSSGTLFLYACQSTELAREEESIEHGIMTHYFIESVESEGLYDQDGILTPGRIQEYVAKKVALHSSFAQLPVIENRVVGYYPFIAKRASVEVGVHEVANATDTAGAVVSTRREISFVAPNRDSREELQRISIEFLRNSIDSFLGTGFEGFTRSDFQNCDEINLYGSDNLKTRIVQDAEGKLKSINRVVYMKKEPIYDPYQTMLNPMLSVLGKRPKPTGYRDVPEIDFDNPFFDSVDVVMKSADIWKVSFGIGAVTYQAKWGGVISPYFYKVDWDGEENNLISTIKKYNYTYLVEVESIAEIPRLHLQIFGDLAKSLADWNRERADELKEFKIKKT